ncbi:MAG TPA: hypothetical protein VM778_05730 [Gemmatimonadota bacterium]|nr:hypothetical protein [Gemmatimonadota bacterium]
MTGAPARPSFLALARAAGLVAIAGAAACASAGSGAGGTRQVPAPGPTTRAEEWITLSDFRHVTSAAASEAVAYFGTTAGLERYDTLRDEWLAPVTVADGLPDGRVTALAAEPVGGDVWIGTARGLARLVPFTGEVEPVSGLPPIAVQRVLVDPVRGNVFVLSGSGWWSGSSGSSFLSRSGPPPPDARLAGSVPASELDPRVVPWMDPRRVRSDAWMGRLFALTGVARDFRGDWYAGTWGDNARRWGAGRAAWEPLYFGLAGPAGGPVVRAADGYWFVPGAERAEPMAARLSALAGGLRAEVEFGDEAPVALAHASPRLDRWSYAAPGLDAGLAAAAAHAAVAIGDTLWLATDAGLVRGTGGEWRTWGAFEGPFTGPLTAVAVDGPTLWVGARDGLVAWDRATSAAGGRWLRGRSVTALAAGPEGVFAGTDGGLWAVGRDGDATIVPTLGRTVRALVLAEGLLLVATDWGLEARELRSGGWTRVGREDLRLGGAPLALAAEGPRVWVGTDRGLARWRRDTDEWERWDEADGLAGAPVRHLLADGDAVWASTPNGVSRYAWRAAEGE